MYLAPMAGVTDIVFRRICKELGADVMVTEFVSSEGIVRRDDRCQQRAQQAQQRHRGRDHGHRRVAKGKPDVASEEPRPGTGRGGRDVGFGCAMRGGAHPPRPWSGLTCPAA